MNEELWNMNVVPSVHVCGWRVLIDRIPTRVNLSSREVQITTSQCPLCNMHDESTQHLFLNCLVATKVWASCDRWIGNSLVNHYSISNHF